MDESGENYRDSEMVCTRDTLKKLLFPVGELLQIADMNTA
jgi:hypothetical protein